MSEMDSDPGRSAGENGGGKSGFSWLRLLPVAVLIAGAVAFWHFNLDEYVSFETLREQRQWLTASVAEYGILAALVYLVAYAVAVAFSLPLGLFLSLTGGFLFGEWFGTLYTVIGATAGATVLFIIAKSALGDLLRKKAGPWLARVEAGFQENAFSYLLVLRLVPLFPFWVVNLVPAFLGVPLRIFVLGTFFGILPGSFVYNLTGAGLGSIFDSGETFSAGSILTPEIIAALVGLAVLAMVPVLYRKIRGAASNGDDA